MAHLQCGFVWFEVYIEVYVYLFIYRWLLAVLSFQYLLKLVELLLKRNLDILVVCFTIDWGNTFMVGRLVRYIFFVVCLETVQMCFFPRFCFGFAVHSSRK